MRIRESRIRRPTDQYPKQVMFEAYNRQHPLSLKLPAYIQGSSRALTAQSETSFVHRLSRSMMPVPLSLIAHLDERIHYRSDDMYSVATDHDYMKLRPPCHTPKAAASTTPPTPVKLNIHA